MFSCPVGAPVVLIEVAVVHPGSVHPGFVHPGLPAVRELASSNTMQCACMQFTNMHLGSILADVNWSSPPEDSSANCRLHVATPDAR